MLAYSSSNNSDDKELYELCIRRDWHKVVRVAQNQPDLAQYVGAEGTPLHVACMGRPSVRVVRQLLSAFPGATDTPSLVSSGALLPLHLACRYNASVSVLRALVQASPQSSIGKTAAHDTPVNVLCEAEENTETSHVRTNSSVLWHKCRDDLPQVNYKSLFWQKIQVLLEAVATYRQQQQQQASRVSETVDRTLYILHAAVSLEECCPVDVLHYALQHYPEQIRLRDPTGRLPLHLAISWSVHRQTHQQQQPQPSLRKFQPKERQVSCQLLEHYPNAAHRRDGHQDHNKDRYPLHTALAHGHEWHAGGVVREIYQCAPHVLAERDPHTQLYPFQMSANDLDSTYLLLRQLPSVLQECLARAKPENTVVVMARKEDEDDEDEELFQSAADLDLGDDSSNSTLFFDACFGDDDIVAEGTKPKPSSREEKEDHGPTSLMVLADDLVPQWVAHRGSSKDVYAQVSFFRSDISCCCRLF